jgi:hypothetical protein
MEVYKAFLFFPNPPTALMQLRTNLLNYESKNRLLKKKKQIPKAKT